MIEFLKKYRIYTFSLILFIYCILLVILTSLPGNPASKTYQMDKLYHIAAYGLLSFILYFFLIFQNRVQFLKKFPATFTLILATTFGFMNELHQIFIPTRTFNKYDIFANLIGIVVSIVVIKFFLAVNKSFNSAWSNCPISFINDS